jgi:type VI secretion system secreted protein Hcp
MAFEGYLKIDGVPGECTEDKHADWIEVLSFDHGITQPTSATASSAGGGTTGQSEHKDFSFVKYIDKASPKLYELCSTGKHIKDATLELWRAGGDKVKYLEVVMEEVVISGVHPGASKTSDGFPTESVSLNYGTIKWVYTQQKRKDGSGGGNVTGGWDLIKGKVKS